MTALYSGGCLCGAIRFEGNVEPELTFFCHCMDCQKESGSAFAVEFCVPRNSVSIVGKLHEHSVIGGSGKQITRRFCAICSSPIVVELAGHPDHLCVNAGGLDDASWLVPQMHLFTANKQPWIHIADNYRTK